MSSIARIVGRRNGRLSQAAHLWTRGNGAPRKDAEGIIRSTTRIHAGNGVVVRFYNEIAALRLRESLEERRAAKREAKRNRQPSERARARSRLHASVEERAQPFKSNALEELSQAMDEREIESRRKFREGNEEICRMLAAATEKVKGAAPPQPEQEPDPNEG